MQTSLQLRSPAARPVRAYGMPSRLTGLTPQHPRLSDLFGGSSLLRLPLVLFPRAAERFASLLRLWPCWNRGAHCVLCQHFMSVCNPSAADLDFPLHRKTENSLCSKAEHTLSE